MGSITWKFVKQLKDDTNINEYEAKYITLPIDLREVIAEYNGARPNKKIFDTLNTKERVFNSLISFRKEDKMNIFFVMEYLAKDFPENLDF